MATRMANKGMGLDRQNNNFAHAHAFSVYISLPSLHNYDAKMPIFTFCRGREHVTCNDFLFRQPSPRAVASSQARRRHSASRLLNSVSYLHDAKLSPLTPVRSLLSRLEELDDAQ